ncbi:hypothetical protein BGX38DRAFT_1266262 [Terfezia claveryi]|nr:hypothetical protein BGX38DRAFT_1266262 [Terfezia claveryi]
MSSFNIGRSSPPCQEDELGYNDEDDMDGNEDEDDDGGDGFTIKGDVMDGGWKVMDASVEVSHT